MNVNDIVNRVSKYDSNLAKEISRYLNSRKYGLVYEESKPEFVRLPNKTVVKGDLVNILPPRGTLENDDAKYKDKWKVTSVDKNSNEAKLISLEKDHKEVTANYDDLVSIARFDQPIYPGLKEVDRIERGKDKPFNTVINGENFHALETLMYAYQGKVDCIFIDPPYNTGAKDWKYNNDYVSADDSYRHSKWLTFMEDRLKLAKKLLNPNDSVLICTIDEKEYARLGILLEQLFPEAKIQMVSSVISHHGAVRFNEFTRVNEFIYFVMLGNYSITSFESSGYVKKGSKIHWQSFRRSSPANIRTSRPSQFYPIYVDIQSKKIKKIGDPITPDVDRHSVPNILGCETVFPVRKDGTEMLWGLTPDASRNLLSHGYLKAGKYYPNDPQKYSIQYLMKGTIDAIKNGSIKVVGKNSDGSIIAINNKTKRVMPRTQWNFKSHDARDYGTKLLKKTLGELRFDFPKSLYAVHDCIRYFVANKPHAIILDFFAGSGTTMQAVNLLNAEDNGFRQCICVTNNEVSAREAKKFTQKKLRSGDDQWEQKGIAKYVTWPRVKCAIQGKDIHGKNLIGDYGSTLSYFEKAVVKSPQGKKQTLYEKKEKPFYPDLQGHKLSDGFKENAIFFDLEYLEPSVIKSDLAFNQIAPLLWLKAGSKGRIIQHTDDYDITNEYAVLFNYKYIGRFTRELKQHPEIKTVFIVTDVNSRYQDLCHELSNKKVYKLYESYLKSFEIQSLN